MLFWVLLWVGLVLVAFVVLGLLARMLWRKIKALTSELGQATDRFTAVSASFAELADRADPPDRADRGTRRH